MEYLDLPAVSQAAGTVRLPGSKSISNRCLLLARADGEGLEAIFDCARTRRDAWLESMLPPGE